MKLLALQSLEVILDSSGAKPCVGRVLNAGILFTLSLLALAAVLGYVYVQAVQKNRQESRSQGRSDGPASSDRNRRVLILVLTIVAASIAVLLLWPR
jgi:uncharacterized membrane protein YebE (DUF533 family)